MVCRQIHQTLQQSSTSLALTLQHLSQVCRAHTRRASSPAYRIPTPCKKFGRNGYFVLVVPIHFVYTSLFRNRSTVPKVSRLRVYLTTRFIIMQEKNALCAQFSARFTEALGSSGLRQKDLAEHTNIREQTLSRYKTGERIPDTYELYRIAVALGISIDWLLGINQPSDSSSSQHSPTVREAKLTEKLAIATAGLEGILEQLKKQ